MTQRYDIPDNISDLFVNGEREYSIVDYTIGEMDNQQSMVYFVETVGIPSEQIVGDWGTQVEIKHPDFKHHLFIDSGGLGDFFSHSFVVSMPS